MRREAAAGGVGKRLFNHARPDGVVIRNVVVEGAVPGSYDLGELRAALETWMTAIEGVRRDAG